MLTPARAVIYQFFFDSPIYINTYIYFKRTYCDYYLLFRKNIWKKIVALYSIFFVYVENVLWIINIFLFISNHDNENLTQNRSEKQIYVKVNHLLVWPKNQLWSDDFHKCSKAIENITVKKFGRIIELHIHIREVKIKQKFTHRTTTCKLTLMLVKYSHEKYINSNFQLNNIYTFMITSWSF